MKRLLLLTLIFSVYLLSAEDSEEKLFSLEEETYHSTELSQMLQILRENPINMLSASPLELSQLPWFSEADIQKIITARKKGALNSKPDLYDCGIDAVTISEISEYITFKKIVPKNFEQRSRLEYSEKYREMPSTLKYYQRTIYDHGKFSLGFLSQKDQLERDPLDFYSYFLQFKSDDLIKNAIVGKYRLAMGQGILFAPKLGMSKTSSSTSTPRKNFSYIKPYTSSYEIWDLEGAAFRLGTKSLSFIPYFSQTFLSANSDSTGITSFNLSGLHLIDSNKDNVKETLFGSALQFHKTDLKIGMNLNKLEFDQPFSEAKLANEFWAASLDWNMKLQQIPIFGEIAIADEKTAAVGGFKLIDERLRQLILFRIYPKDFPTWHGHPFSAQSDFDNEIGIYYGLTYLPWQKTKLNCFIDIWKHPQARYFENMPTVGSEQFFQLERKFKVNSIRIMLQNKSKEKYISLVDAKIRQFQRTTFRFDWWQNLAVIRFKSRLEFVSEYLREDSIWEKGMLAYQQVKLKLAELEFIAQITAYHSEILHYVYEYNVDGVMQNAILSEDGIHSFLLVNLSILNNWELQTKISKTWDQDDSLKLFFQSNLKF